MGNRLTKIYTRTGDDGTTGLGNGERVPKEHTRVEAFGTVDELNCAVGQLLAQLPDGDPLSDVLAGIQHRLFDLGGELSIPGHRMIQPDHVTELEKVLDGYNAELPPLRDFILPGGSQAAASCHLARAMCRRAERRTWVLARREEVNPEALRYLNRLSDLLFVLARVLSRRNGGTEVIWQTNR